MSSLRTDRPQIEAMMVRAISRSFREGNGSLIPFSAPSEPDEYEYSTAARKPCDACGEWVYPRRKKESKGSFTFGPECVVCGATLPREE